MSERSGSDGATDTAGVFQRAVSLHQSGELEQAGYLYRQILDARPGHVDALHLLGLVAHQQGRNGEARDLVERAIAQDPGPAYLHNNLGEVLRALGDLSGAERCYRAAVERDAGYAQAWNNLGMALHAQSRHEEALEAFERALSSGADAVLVQNNIGMVQQALGSLEEAIATFRSAVELDPSRPEPHNNLGAALMKSGRREEAERALEEAVRIAPDLARAHFNLARLRAEDGDHPGAEADCRTAIELEPEEADYHVTLAFTLRAQERFDESIEALRRAVALDPGHATAHNDLGVSLLVEGDFDAAAEAFAQAIEHDPGLSVAWENLARARRFGPGDGADVARVEQQLASLAEGDPGRVHLHFAAAKMLDDREEHDRAFAHYEAANAIARSGAPFERARAEALVEETRRVVTAGLVAEKAELGSDDETPIFVVGMPRSGTTLVEQILASHPGVKGGGEIGFFRRLAGELPARLGAGAYPECLASLGGEALGEIASEYLIRLARGTEEAERITDKMPLNFEHLGLIAMTFARAAIVHCRRDPLDTCLSIYFTHFAYDNEYAYDVGDIATYYRCYRALMDHWHEVLPGRIHEVRYEELVTDLEPNARALLDACGLAWDNRCLRPHETRRRVGTASHWQVRQPVTPAAVGRWKHYDQHLGAMREALGDLVEGSPGS